MSQQLFDMAEFIQEKIRKKWLLVLAMPPILMQNNAVVFSCWLPHDLTRLIHETALPTLANNKFTLNPSSGGWGSIA